jgi:Ca-activated chloride channel family protein
MRRYLKETGKRPPVDSVRIEEYVNYFKYDYAQPTDGKPFATHIDISPCPWEPKHLLARIGIKGKEYSTEERPALNLVFLIDVSGSMQASNRLPLVKRGLTELVEMLQPKDRVAIVTYAGASRVALPSVSGQEKRAILDSINSLDAGGSTAGAAGIKTAYEVAKKYYDKKAQNRVILCTDGDFNVGETNNKTLETMIGDEAKSGVFLTILGFGMGNYKDERLKTLSMRGNGNYGYIDTPEEARRLLVEGLTGTLFAIAKDVKIQIDFNPAKIAGYRLIGYENRKLRDEDFHNDKIDAGEIGAGHTVTALYELVPIGERIPATVDQSRYDNKIPATDKSNNNNNDNNNDIPENTEKSKEFLFVKLRYKLPDEDKSSLLEYPASAVSETMSPDSQFAAATALFGMLLRESRHSGHGTFDRVLELATPNTKNDQYRNEFIDLVKKAKELK